MQNQYFTEDGVQSRTTARISSPQPGCFRYPDPIVAANEDEPTLRKLLGAYSPAPQTSAIIKVREHSRQLAAVLNTPERITKQKAKKFKTTKSKETPKASYQCKKFTNKRNWLDPVFKVGVGFMMIAQSIQTVVISAVVAD